MINLSVIERVKHPIAAVQCARDSQEIMGGIHETAKSILLEFRSRWQDFTLKLKNLADRFSS